MDGEWGNVSIYIQVALAKKYPRLARDEPSYYWSSLMSLMSSVTAKK